MKVHIDNSEYNISDFSRLKKGKQLGGDEYINAVYLLKGISNALNEEIRQFILNAHKFDIEITDKGNILLEGEDCLCYGLTPFNNTIELHIGLTKESLHTA